MATLKNWMSHKDPVLSRLCRSLIDRRLFKVVMQKEPIDEAWVEECRSSVRRELQLPEKILPYFVFTGETVNTTYDPNDERIQILFKDGTVRDISQVDNALIHQALASPLKKNYICYYREG
jgi:hypothetical protein